MYKTLKDLLEETVAFIGLNYKNKQLAFDCNSDYGQVFVSVNKAPETVLIESFFGDNAEDFYWFGNWEIPDIRDEHSAIDKLWRAKWDKFEGVIRDDWMDLSSFEEKVKRKDFLDKVCKIAASIKREAPILVADHDEHISYTTKRMEWAYGSTSGIIETQLVANRWISKDDPEFNNLLALFKDGSFINCAQFPDVEDEMVFEGDWILIGNSIQMTVSESNLEEDDFVGEKGTYVISEVDGIKLVYKDSETTYQYSTLI